VGSSYATFIPILCIHFIIIGYPPNCSWLIAVIAYILLLLLHRMMSAIFLFILMHLAYCLWFLYVVRYGMHCNLLSTSYLSLPHHSGSILFTLLPSGALVPFLYELYLCGHMTTGYGMCHSDCVIVLILIYSFIYTVPHIPDLFTLLRTTCILACYLDLIVLCIILFPLSPSSLNTFSCC